MYRLARIVRIYLCCILADRAVQGQLYAGLATLKQVEHVCTSELDMKRVLRRILSHYGLDHMARACETLNQSSDYGLVRFARKGAMIADQKASLLL